MNMRPKDNRGEIACLLTGCKAFPKEALNVDDDSTAITICFVCFFVINHFGFSFNFKLLLLLNLFFLYFQFFFFRAIMLSIVDNLAVVVCITFLC